LKIKLKDNMTKNVNRHKFKISMAHCLGMMVFILFSNVNGVHAQKKKDQRTRPKMDMDRVGDIPQRDRGGDVRIAWDRNTYQEMTSVHVANKDITEKNLYYARIKKLSDGTLMMSFSDDHFGWNIYVRKSGDNG